MVAFLTSELQWQVHPVQSKQDAVEQLTSGALMPDLVLIDQVLDSDANGGTNAIQDIVRASPHSFVVVYTADPTIDQDLLWRALAAGAHRCIRKGSSTELLRDFQELIDEVEELAEITALVSDVTKTHNMMVATLLGAGVKVSIIDRYHRVWFSNRPEAAANAPPQGGPCWTYFHGTSVEWGPCSGCVLRGCIDRQHPRSSTIFVRTIGGRPEWARVDSLPIPSKRRADRRVIAVRETYMPLRPESVSIAPQERLQAIVDGILLEGYGRVRVYSPEHGQGHEYFVGVACALRTSDPTYHETFQNLRISLRDDPYVQRAVEERDGTLWNAWDPAPQGATANIAMQIGLTPPWVDLPVWNNQDLIGWLAVDLKGSPKEAITLSDMETLRCYRDEIASVLRPDPVQTKEHTHFRHLLTEARFQVAQARAPQEALDQIIQVAHKVIESVAGCEDVRVRMRRGGYLVVQTRLPQRLQYGAGDETPESISEADSKSFAAFVAAVGSPLYIDDRIEYRMRTLTNPALRPGLRKPRVGSLAILPLKVENICFGTLSIECSRIVNWRSSAALPYLLEVAGFAALAVRDLHVQNEIAEGKKAVERELEQAFGAIHGIKGPASAVRNALAVLRAQQLTPLGVEATDLVEAAITRIERLAARLMRMTRRDATRANLQRCLAHDLMLACCRAAATAEPALDVHLPGVLPQATVCVAEPELRAVFEELATNSVRAKATTINVHASVEGTQLVVYFDDNGQGFKPEYADRIFERWFSDVGGGNGLGLAWVRTVVSEWGGRVRAQPLERGARIEITIPCERVQADGN